MDYCSAFLNDNEAVIKKDTHCSEILFIINKIFSRCHEMITQQIKEYVQSEAKNRTITDIRAGLSYSCVELDGKDLGTPKDQTTRMCCAGRSQGLFIGETADKLIDHLGDTKDLLTSCLGFACVNAMVNNNQNDFDEGDILNELNLKPDDITGMIGSFAPLIKPIKQSTKKLLIFERKPSDVFLSEEEIAEKLPLCQVAIITATTLIDNKLDKILMYFKNCREVILLGPTLPLLKDLYKPYGVTLISGIQVMNREKLKQIISHGFGMGHFKETVRKINFRLRSN